MVLAVVAIVGTLRFVPESAQPAAPPVDKGGALIATVGLVALVFSIIEAPDAGWLSARTLGGVAVGLAALAGFVLFELRRRHPLLNPRLFTNRRLAAGSLSICIQFFAFFGFTFVSLQYLQGVRGYSPIIAALAVLPLTAAMMPTSRVTATLVARFGARACSALNDLSREVGGALGTAVLGSVVTAVYRSSLQLRGIPAPVVHQAQQSFAIAIHAGGPVGAHARDAFVDGIHAGLLYAAGAAILAAIAVATLLTRDVKIRPAAEADQRQLASVGW